MQARLELDFGPSISESTSVSALDNAQLPKHRWYFFKEAFSPYFVRHAINEAQLKPDEVVFDPFSGSGTVCLTAREMGYEALGTEVNPFLAFVANTKLTNCRPAVLINYGDSVLKGTELGKHSKLENFSTFSESDDSIKWLFNRSVLQAFEGGWHATIGMYPPARDLLRLALLGSALDVANATKDGKCLRYKKDWRYRNYSKDDFASSLLQRITMISNDLSNFAPARLANKVVNADIRTYDWNLDTHRRFTLCVTSPPYLNSFDYTDVYRPELFLGKFVRSQEALRELRLSTIRSHVQTNWKQPIDQEFGETFKNVYSRIEQRKELLWDNRIPAMIKAYFEDLQLVLRKLRAAAAEKASLWLVVSTSAYVGIEIPVDQILAEIASKTGWYLREVTVLRHLRRVSGQQWSDLAQDKTRPYLRESVIILDTLPKK